MDKQLMISKVEEINSLHKEVHTGIRMTLERVVRIGQLLTECKKEYGDHGVWMEWVKMNCSFSQSTCNNYMRAYENRDNPKINNVVNLKDIYYPQIEHKEPVKKESKQPEPEPLPARLQPFVEEPNGYLFSADKVSNGKKDVPKEPEVVDEQNEWVEDIKDLYVKLDDDHKGLVIDWILEYKEAA